MAAPASIPDRIYTPANVHRTSPAPNVRMRSHLAKKVIPVKMAALVMMKPQIAATNVIVWRIGAVHYARRKWSLAWTNPAAMAAVATPRKVFNVTALVAIADASVNCMWTTAIRIPARMLVAVSWPRPAITSVNAAAVLRAACASRISMIVREIHVITAAPALIWSINSVVNVYPATWAPSAPIKWIYVWPNLAPTAAPARTWITITNAHVAPVSQVKIVRLTLTNACRRRVATVAPAWIASTVSIAFAPTTSTVNSARRSPMRPRRIMHANTRPHRRHAAMAWQVDRSFSLPYFR